MIILIHSKLVLNFTPNAQFFSAIYVFPPTKLMQTIDETDIHKYFGDSAQLGSGYVLFYQARDLDMDTIAPMQWAQQQLQSFSLKSPINGTSPFSPTNGLGLADLDQYGGLMPHTQQQELIHQQLASRQQQQQVQQQQQNGGGVMGALFNGGSAPSPVTQAHMTNGSGGTAGNGGPRSPTQIQDPSMLNGQKITSGSYVYTNGIAAAASSGQPHYTSTNGYHSHSTTGTIPSDPLPLPHTMSSPSPASTSHYSSSYNHSNGHGNGNGHGHAHGHSQGHGPVPPSPTATSHHYKPSSSVSSASPSPSASTIHTTIDPAKLKRAQSTPRITLASAAKTFGSSGGKSFIGSLRGGSSS